MKLKDEDDRWCDQHLRAMKARLNPAPSDEEIAMAAYYLWQQEGCPAGREAEHWAKAREQLRGRDRPLPPAT